MPREINMEAINAKIMDIKAAATGLHQMADAFRSSAGIRPESSPAKRCWRSACLTSCTSRPNNITHGLC